MSYIVIRVYNFERPPLGCDVTNVEVMPAMGGTIRAALKELRESERWTVKDGKHYCPKHTVPV